MKTPICDFVRNYCQQDGLRLHMPGHKGASFLGMESADITEISGADSLYEASGIIAESEKNASELFGVPTYYSTEGSSQCIRAMIYLASVCALEKGRKPKIAAARNVHKTFLYAAALLDIEVKWICGEGESYLSCNISEKEARKLFASDDEISALYITSPDYLGNMAELRGLARVCRENGALLLVDNAHGAYLKFLHESVHPMDMGAHICCSSAHKTLSVLTGGAYLHISEELGIDGARAKNALALFGSTSPSYLILQSLDAANRYLAEGYGEKLSVFTEELCKMKERLFGAGYTFCGNEPMKLTIRAKSYGYRGTELAERLGRMGIEAEFSDPDHLVLMPTPETGSVGLRRIENALASIEKRAEINEKPPVPFMSRSAMSPRDAIMRPSECVDASVSLGRILASPSVGCPPAVPIIICGEIIDENAISAFEYYGIEKVFVVK